MSGEEGPVDTRKSDSAMPSETDAGALVTVLKRVQCEGCSEWFSGDEQGLRQLRTHHQVFHG